MYTISARRAISTLLLKRPKATASATHSAPSLMTRASPAPVAALGATASALCILGNRVKKELKGEKVMKYFAEYVALMDDELREQVHQELSPCTDEEFLNRYQELHNEKYGEDLEI